MIEEGWHGTEANTESFKRAMSWMLRCKQASHTYWSHALTNIANVYRIVGNFCGRKLSQILWLFTKVFSTKFGGVAPLVLQK